MAAITEGRISRLIQGLHNRLAEARRAPAAFLAPEERSEPDQAHPDDRVEAEESSAGHLCPICQEWRPAPLTAYRGKPLCGRCKKELTS